MNARLFFSAARLLIILLALFSCACVDYGPSKAERDARKQAFLNDHNLLRLQLAKCERYKNSTDLPGQCPGASLAYETMSKGPDCQIAAEVAKELGIASLNLAIPTAKAQEAQPIRR